MPNQFELLFSPLQIRNKTVKNRIVSTAHQTTLVADGLSAVLVSHDLRQAKRLADDVVVLDHGRVVETGPAESSRYFA